MPDPVRIAVDAMGGDFAPTVNIRGALQALAEDTNLHVTLVGIGSIIRQELAKVAKGAAGGLHDGDADGDPSSSRLSIVEASEIITMEDHAASVIRKKKDSSIHVGLRLVKDGKADAFISAGNSGAVMAGALLLLGRIGDLERPAIVVRLPTADGFVIVLDVGANVDCRASHLGDFALMGKAYAEFIAGIKNPRIALISNGSEPHKGNELTREAHTLLEKQKGLNYIGYIEGFDLFRGKCDVVVCDGFVGNVILKSTEGFADAIIQWFRSHLKGNLIGLAGVVLLRNVLRKFRRKFDYQPYGAAPLLGINGMVLISHGGSTEVAICSGILAAKKGVEHHFIEKISGVLARREAH